MFKTRHLARRSTGNLLEERLASVWGALNVAFPVATSVGTGNLGYDTETPALVAHQAHSETIGLSMRFGMPEKVYFQGSVRGSVDQAGGETHSGSERLRTQRVR